MGRKKVTVFKVQIIDNIYDFANILLNRDFWSPVDINEDKKSELISVVQNSTNHLITGLFITTQKKGIPPAHTPGGEDFSAIELEADQGLAYPNMMLYDPRNSSIYLESNRSGLSQKTLIQYFQMHAHFLNLTDFSIILSPILQSDAYARVSNMSMINSMEIKIANPSELIQRNLLHAPLLDFAHASMAVNASKNLKIELKGEIINSGLNKQNVLRIMDDFSSLMRFDSLSKKSKCKIRGSVNIEDVEVEDLVDFILDTIVDWFNLDEPAVSSSPQISERRNGILGVYNRTSPIVRSIIG